MERTFPITSPAIGNERHRGRARLDANTFVETAYAVHGAALVRRLTALTRDPVAAEDLAQEAFLRLAIEAGDGRMPDNVGGWLHRVAVNLVTSRGRRLTVAERRRRELPQPGLTPSPEAATVAAEDARAVRVALDGLGETDRRALLLAAHGYRGPEIARRLGRTEGATRTLLCRARSKVRNQLVAAGLAP